MPLITLARALPLDLALTLGQACQLTGHPPHAVLDHAQQAGYHVVEHRLGLTRNSALGPVTFICRDARTAAYDADLLRQLAGTAALRHLCGAGSAVWRVCAHHGATRLASGQWLSQPTPDAEWESWDGNGDCITWAVEYDAGSHTYDTLTKRLMTYAQPARRGDIPRPQLWGAATLTRTLALIELARQALPPEALVIVRTVDWCPTLPPHDGVGQWLRIPASGETL